jgi:hypothetical protein
MIVEAIWKGRGAPVRIAYIRGSEYDHLLTSVAMPYLLSTENKTTIYVPEPAEFGRAASCVLHARSDIQMRTGGNTSHFIIQSKTRNATAILINIHPFNAHKTVLKNVCATDQSNAATYSSWQSSEHLLADVRYGDN